ncbi:NAD-dependent epimerase/dehydratase family protein [Pseudacidovorax intermedius]|uniref:NAD-dependent epimerase/dehydratase domain-containing protein n=1 Tax=Pseudacidovorax intermedius TaxID=433924 RepID=A0A147GSC3_9BURK|nr:NAD(P)-dependent oxidoreductase [Pseudacidovorax intermedius]KTT19289.1 hypothetical protein NS331_14760 [Pseudacidovorax intermedius]
MKILITGITGFTGNALASALRASGHEIYGLSRTPERSADSSTFYYDGTIDSISSALKRAQPKLVIHVASLFLVEHKRSDIENLIDANITFGTQLLDSMSECLIDCFITTGSGWQDYEGRRDAPVNLYAATKTAFEKICQYYAEAKGIRTLVLKLGDSYGEGDKRRKILNLLVDAVTSGVELDVSPGDQLIAMAHVDDVVSAYTCAINYLCSEHAQNFQVFHAYGKEYSLKEIAAHVESTFGKKLKVNFGGRPYRNREVMKLYPVDDSVPNWKARISLRQGLEEIKERKK